MLHFHISFVLRAEFFVLKIYLIEDFAVRAPLQSVGIRGDFFPPCLSSWHRQLNKTAEVETSAFEGKPFDLF